MKFEELQSLWDCQNNESNSRLDANSVLASVRSRSQKMGRELCLFEWILISMLFFVGLMAMKDPVLQGHDMHQIATGLLCLGSAAFICRGRLRRRRAEIQFDDSLLGVIEKSIAQLNYKASQMRGYLWFCIVPLSVGVVVGYLQSDPSKRIWFYALIFPLFVFMMSLSYFGMRWEVKRFSLPQLAELEALKAKLLEPEEDMV